MSIWLGKPDENGKRSIYFAEIPYQVLLFAFIAIVFFVGPRYASGSGQLVLDAAAVVAAGFVMYLASKVSLFVRGIWVSWGAGRMARPFKVMYAVGLVLMLLGAAMLALGIGLG